MAECADIIEIAERKLANAIRNLALAEKKAAADGLLASADEVARRDREVAWRLHALRILRGEDADPSGVPGHDED